MRFRDTARFRGRSGSGQALLAEASAVFARMTTAPNASQQQALNRLIYDLKQINRFATRDVIFGGLPGNEQGWQRNWRQNAFNLSPTTAIFDAAKGCYYGNGSGIGATAGLNLSTAVGLNAKQNDINISFWPLDGTGAYVGGTGNLRLGGVAPAATGAFGATHGTVTARLNSATTRAMSNIPGPFDLHSYNRSASGQWTLRVGGQLVGTWADASTVFDNADFEFITNPVGRTSTSRVAFYMIGSALTPHDEVRVAWAVRRYMISMGIINDNLSAYDDSVSLNLGDTAQRFLTQTARKSWSLTKRSNYFEFDVRNGDIAQVDIDNGTIDRNRSELSQAVVAGYGIGAPIWNSFTLEVMPDSDLYTGAGDSNPYMILGTQVHANDSITPASPVFTLSAINELAVGAERLNAASRYDATSRNPPIATTEFTPVSSDSPIVRGKLYRIVTKLQFKTDGTGIEQVWCNGAAPINRPATNIGYAFATTNNLGYYYKKGIYRHINSLRTHIRLHNPEIGTADLSARIAAPLPVFDANGNER